MTAVVCRFFKLTDKVSWTFLRDNIFLNSAMLIKPETPFEKISQIQIPHYPDKST